MRHKPPAPSRALPATVADLEAQRIVKRSVTLLDETERALLALYDDPQFRAYRGIDDPDMTVEGSTVVDDVMATQMIREKALELDLPLVKAANLTELSLKLRRAESRFNASRNQRRKVGGEAAS
jgi:hypothetical protein